jgi:superoxide dismutase, Fe-Mn family
MFHDLPELPYEFDSLEPHIDAQTMEIHYTKHHQGYVNKLNTALEQAPDWQEVSIEELLASLEKVPQAIRTAVRNNGGGTANHTLYWLNMDPDAGGKPEGELAAAMDEQFVDFSKFQEKFTQAALSIFGSGWAWLSMDENRSLFIETTPNQDNPLMRGSKPILGLDMWEHAYYLKHQNQKADYIKSWWNVVNWENVAKWFAGSTWYAQPVHKS